MSPTRKTTNLEIDIFRKPTTTDTTINYLSNHPLEQNLAAYRLYIDRMFNLPLNKENQQKEWTTILEIARNNNFPDNLLIRLRQQTLQKINRTNHPRPPKTTPSGRHSLIHHHKSEKSQIFSNTQM
jgi:hypothetical protein